MNPDWLLKHFEQISEAPDAVPRLRRFILDLAVRGKLVEQDPADEPAAELLKRIQAKKQKLIRGCSGAKGRPLLIIDDEIPFEIPETWVWLKSTEPAVLISDKGKKLQTKDVLESGEFPVVDQGKVFVRGYCNDVQKVIRVDGPIIVFGDHTRETKLIDFDFVVGADGVKLLKPIEIDPAYYFLALQWVPLDSRGYARHFKLLRASRFPLPPLAEQHRIVAKVDELMALCDKLEAAQAKRERRRDRLVAATLHGLGRDVLPKRPQSNEDGALGESTLPGETALPSFFLNHLPRLTTRPEHIRQLRQTILNLAIRGKLVPQDPNEGSGSDLLDTVRKKKEQLLLERRIRGEKDVEYSMPLYLADIPPTWIWAHVDDVAIVQGGKRLPKGTSFSKVPTPHIYIRVTDMKNGTISADDLQFITPETQRAIARYVINQDDLYITIAGTIGQVGRVPALFDGHNLTENAAKLVFRGLNPEYFRLALSAESVQQQFRDKTKQMAQPKLALKRISGAKFPLPPLAEQHQIVAKVDELMALCDELETRLTEDATTRHQLLEVTLHKALTGHQELHQMAAL